VSRLAPSPPPAGGNFCECESDGDSPVFGGLVTPEAIAMPSLFRFLTILAVITGVVYGVIFALANFVSPKPREMTFTISQDKFLKK
jgi:hypothetical protein